MQRSSEYNGFPEGIDVYECCCNNSWSFPYKPDTDDLSL